MSQIFRLFVASLHINVIHMQLSHDLKFASAQGKYGNLNIGNILGHYTYPCQTAYRVFIKIQSQAC